MAHWVAHGREPLDSLGAAAMAPMQPDPLSRNFMPRLPTPWLLLLLCCLLPACRQEAPAQRPAKVIDAPANGAEGGALSGGPVKPAPPAPAILDGSEWPVAEVVSGEAFIDCGDAPLAARAPQANPRVGGDDDAQEEQQEQAPRQGQQPLINLSFASIEQAVAPCEGADVLRLRYSGKIASDFTDLLQRVANMAERMAVSTRILQLDSAGGHVEDAMKAGDAIGASRWTIRVGPDANCHSACVLILAAGDQREIEGRVGVHRMLRVGSAATTREELTNELREVHSHMKDYLERNGAAVIVADLMMTVPNRKLRLLNQDELLEYGLLGANAVQDDLERIQLTRKCGDDFVRRKDDYDRAFSRQCADPQQDLEAVQSCGVALRKGFGFPDEKCPVESPLSHYDDPASAALGQVGLE